MQRDNQPKPKQPPYYLVNSDPEVNNDSKIMNRHLYCSKERDKRRNNWFFCICCVKIFVVGIILIIRSSCLKRLHGTITYFKPEYEIVMLEAIFWAWSLGFMMVGFTNGIHKDPDSKSQ